MENSILFMMEAKQGILDLLYGKTIKKNRYLVLRFDSDKLRDVSKKDRGVKHITKLKHPTEKSVFNSYVHNRPMKCKRKDVGIILPNLYIHQDDMRLIKQISQRNPEMSPSLRR